MMGKKRRILKKSRFSAFISTASPEIRFGLHTFQTLGSSQF
jgi:hypothetical protein